MLTTAHAYLHTNSFVHTENIFRSALQNAGKRSDLSAIASSGTPALSLYRTVQVCVGRVFQQQCCPFLDQSTQHFDIGPYKTTLRKHSHIYVACLYCHIRFMCTLTRCALFACSFKYCHLLELCIDIDIDIELNFIQHNQKYRFSVVTI